MLNFEFQSPTKIFFGKGVENKLGEVLKEAGHHKVLLHYGMGSIFKSGLYDKLMASLKEAGLEVFELGGVEANPKIDLVRKGVALVKEKGIDAVVACGGGSVIDSAKLIAVAGTSDVDPWEYSMHHEQVSSTLDLAVVLTISAAGSELSNSCVISNPVNNLKRGFNSDLIRPKWAFMNPDLTYSVSKYQTACGVVDILMHTFERYLTYDNAPLTRNMANGLIKTVIEKGLICYNEPNNYDARADIMLASSLSHNGLTGLGIKMFFTVHRLEHEVSGFYPSVAHGAGLAVLFPVWAKEMIPAHAKLFSDFAINALGIKDCGDEIKNANLGIDYLRTYFTELGMPKSLQEFGIKLEDLSKMALSATQDGKQKVLGITDLEYEDVLKIYQKAY